MIVELVTILLLNRYPFLHFEVEGFYKKINFIQEKQVYKFIHRKITTLQFC